MRDAKSEPVRNTVSIVISRYLVREFIGILVPIIAAFLVLYILVDLFDRLNFLLKNHATLGATLRYFAFKIPLILTQTTPPAVLAALLLSLGMLSQRNEVVAMRASGVSLTQTALPLVGLAAVISLATLAWNETVVPESTRQWQSVIHNEIKKGVQRSILSEREIWYLGVDGFYNIEHVDAQGKALVGLTVYRTDAAFDLQEVIEVPFAKWTGSGWEIRGGVEHSIRPDGEIVTQPIPPDQVVIHEKMADFLEVRRQPEELSYRALRQRIDKLSREGFDASGDLVDLYLKLAVPFTTLVLACVAIPLAGRVQRHPSLAAIVGLGFLIGFAYWLVFALTNALGERGVLPAVVSAWAANVIFVLAGIGLFLSSE
jgi:lipopolysaccharide export system permease protein